MPSSGDAKSSDLDPLAGPDLFYKQGAVGRYNPSRAAPGAGFCHVAGAAPGEAVGDRKAKRSRSIL